jgi:hypothetical protein
MMRSTRFGLVRRLGAAFLVVGLASAAASSQLGCGPAAQGLTGGIKRGALDGTVAAQHQQLIADGDAAFAQRADRAQLEASIQKFSEAIKLKDDDWQTYEKLSRATYLLADGWLFFEKDDSDEKMAEFLKVHEQGYTAAERGLAALYPDVEKKLSAGVDLKDASALVDRQGVGLLYWYATNLGKWGKAQDITVAIRYKDRIISVMSKVIDLDREYFHGAPDRYFGTFYSFTPPSFGGDLDKSWDHFQSSLKVAPGYLATYNLIAENYAPKRKDAALFDRMIEAVRSAPLDGIPGLEAEAAIEKRRAELLVKMRENGDFPF